MCIRTLIPVYVNANSWRGVDISLPVYKGVYVNPDTWRGVDISLPVYKGVYVNPDTWRGVDISLPVCNDSIPPRCVATVPQFPG